MDFSIFSTKVCEKLKYITISPSNREKLSDNNLNLKEFDIMFHIKNLYVQRHTFVRSQIYVGDFHFRNSFQKCK